MTIDDLILRVEIGLEWLANIETLLGVIARGVCFIAACALLRTMLTVSNRRNFFNGIAFACFAASVNAGDGLDFVAGSAADTDRPTVEITGGEFTSWFWFDRDPAVHAAGTGSVVNGGGYAYFWLTGTTAYFTVYDPTNTSGDGTVGSATFGAGRHLMVMTGDSTELKGYIDGVLMATYSRTSSTDVQQYFGDHRADGVGIAWGWDSRVWSAAEVSDAWSGTLPDGLTSVFHAGYSDGDLNVIDGSDWSVDIAAVDAPELDIEPYGRYVGGVFELGSDDPPDESSSDNLVIDGEFSQGSTAWGGNGIIAAGEARLSNPYNNYVIQSMDGFEVGDELTFEWDQSFLGEGTDEIVVTVFGSSPAVQETVGGSGRFALDAVAGQSLLQISFSSVDGGAEVRLDDVVGRFADGGGGNMSQEEQDAFVAGGGATFTRPTLGVQPDGSCISGYAVFALVGNDGLPLTAINLTGSASVCIEIGGDGAGYSVGQGGPSGASFGTYGEEVASYYNPIANGNCYWGNAPGEPSSVLAGPGVHPCAVVAFQGWEVGVVSGSSVSTCDCLALANGTPGDADGDGVPDGADTSDPDCGVVATACNDSDGNGVVDEFERPGDLDGDGIPNESDASPRGSGCGSVPDCGADADSDGDGIRNGDDPDGDMDGDGIPDDVDASPQGDACGSSSDCSGAGDSDGDGIRNDADPDGDMDGDGIPDADDVTPFGEGCSSSSLECGPAGDYDGDGIRNDAEEPHETEVLDDGTVVEFFDTDGDGISDRFDVSPYGDGCPVPDPCTPEGDADGDGFRNDSQDEDDEDADGDGIPNVDDLQPFGHCDDCLFWQEQLMATDIVMVDGNCFLRGPRVMREDEDEEGVFEEVEDEDGRLPLGSSGFDWDERFPGAGDCDWDGDGCVNRHDLAPCDPEFGCGCVIDLGSKLKRIENAIYRWIYSKDEQFVRVPVAEQDDDAGSSFARTDGALFLTPVQNEDALSDDFAFDLSVFGRDQPLTFSYRVLPSAAEWADYPQLLPYIAQIRVAWAWFRTLLVVYIGYRFLMRIFNDLMFVSTAL